MHRLLQHQLKRYIGSLESIPDEWKSFIDAVNEAYHQADADYALLERSLDLASEELAEKNKQLQEQVAAEQVRARLAEEQRLALVETLYEISWGLNMAHDENELLQMLAWPAQETGATAASLMYIDLNEAGKPEWAEIVATWQQKGEPATPVGTCFYLPESPFSSLWLASPRKPQLITNLATEGQVDENARNVLTQMGIQAMAIIPLTRTDQWLGLITLNWDRPHEFDRQESAIYESLISLASPAVENRRLVDKLEQMIEERTAELRESLEEREHLQQEIIEAQKQAIQELSTPVIPIIDAPDGSGGIIVMPLVGSIDSMRARDITRSLLAGISQHRAKVVILDVTGVPIVDSSVANHLNKTIQAARLKGARTIVTGISDAVAETVVDLGIDWSGLETLSDLQTGLVVALSSMGIRLAK
jgi:anti-anti-sigma regulatory factor